MGATTSDLRSMVHSYSSIRSHAPHHAKLPLGKPGKRVFDTQSTCSEDGGTTSKKVIDATQKVAPVSGPVEALLAAAAKICAQPGIPACFPDAEGAEDLDAAMPDAEAQTADASPRMVDPSTGLHVHAAKEAQSNAKAYAISKRDELAVMVVVNYPEGHQSVMALSDQPPEGELAPLDARACTLPSITFESEGWAHTLVHEAIAKIFPGDAEMQQRD